MIDCGCDPLQPELPLVTNPPGQSALRWRVATHGNSLARMLAVLAAAPDPRIRALSFGGAGDPAVALLDSWAVVADTVSFYTERLAAEGFLGTATEQGSIRELAHMVGYELRPGVAATADLAFAVDATAAPEVRVPAGTPVQTVPGQDQLPQTFETSEELAARAAWNSITANTIASQVFQFGDTELWLRGTGLGVREGDTLLVVGRERLQFGADPAFGGADRWDMRTVLSVTESPADRDGWTHLAVRGRAGPPGRVAKEEVTVFAFAERANPFGWNALEPVLFSSAAARRAGSSDGTHWDDFTLAAATEPAIDLDGDHPRLQGGDAARVEDGSWVVLQSAEDVALCRATKVTPGGLSRFGLSGRVTSVSLDVLADPSLFDRRTTIVHCRTRPLPAAQAPLSTTVTGRVLALMATDPPLPIGRRILVTGNGVVMSARVQDCGLTAGSMVITLDRNLPAPIEPSALRVFGNVVEATHGETVQEVLGSGDGARPFLRLHPRRGPLTYVRAATPSGARSTMEVRVDGAAWTEVSALDTAGPTDRVYVVRQASEDAADTALVQFGDGIHGARLPTGVENVTGTYRVGIGDTGAAVQDQLSMLPRRPLGIASVRNPAPAEGWAAPETMGGARRNAPLRIRTLERAVSRADHEDFAAAFAGVTAARADEVWDGHTNTVVISVLGADGNPVSGALRADLATALADARDPSVPLRILPGERRWFGIRFALGCDPAYDSAAVADTVRARLAERLSHAARRFADMVTAAEVLVLVRGVPGVAACTLPALLDLPGWVPAASRPDPNAPGVAALAASAARADGTELRAAQILGVANEVVVIEVMSS